MHDALVTEQLDQALEKLADHVLICPVCYDDPDGGLIRTCSRGAALAAGVDAVRAMLPEMAVADGEQVCRECGCTEDDCRNCWVKTGAPCWWLEPDLCSACRSPAIELGGEA